MAKLDDGEFESIVAGSIDDAASFVDDEISPQRALASVYYKGELPDVEAEEGRSRMVSRDVRDTVHSMLPSLLRIFTSSDRVVEYVPTGPEDEKVAEQATDYANHVILAENRGFSMLHAVFKDALIRKVGFVKAWWHESEEVSVQRYTGLSQEALMVLQAEADEVEVHGQELDPIGNVVFDATVSKAKKVGKIRVEEVPPEEVIVARRDKRLGETLIAHRKMMTVSDLVAMGYKLEDVESHTVDSDFEDNEETITRRDRLDEMAGSTTNDALRRCLYVEAYIRVDRDGDGIAELWKVCTIGSGHRVLSAEEVDCHPFVAFAVDPEPHVSPLEASSIADEVMDIQKLKSVVWRNSLDALAQTINPRTLVVEGRAEIQDVLNNEVGAVIRAKSPDAVVPLLTPDTSVQGLQMLAYADEVKEARTGLSKAAVGLDPDALRSTAKNAANAVVSATQSQLEMAARMLSDGMRDLFRLVLKLIRTHQDQAKVIRLRNEWVPIDPRSWSDMDVSINVALGTGTNEERFNVLAGIAAKQEQIMGTLGPQNPLVSLPQYSNTLTKMIELAGFKNAQQFVSQLPADFQLPPPPPPPQDPSLQIAQMGAQVEQMKIQSNERIAAMKAENDQQLAAMKATLELQKIELQAQVGEMSRQMEANFARLMAMMGNTQQVSA